MNDALGITVMIHLKVFANIGTQTNYVNMTNAGNAKYVILSQRRILMKCSVCDSMLMSDGYGEEHLCAQCTIQAIRNNGFDIEKLLGTIAGSEHDSCHCPGCGSEWRSTTIIGKAKSKEYWCGSTFQGGELNASGVCFTIQNLRKQLADTNVILDEYYNRERDGQEYHNEMMRDSYGDA